MSVRHVFIDESGDWGLSRRSSSHFVVSALILPHPNILDKIIKHMRKRGFQAELAGVNEVKASHASERMKRHMISKLNEVSGIMAVFLGLNKVKYLNTHPGSTNWAFYRHAIEKLVGCLDPTIEYNITLDRNLTTNQFDVIKEIFLEYVVIKDSVHFTQSYSFNWSGLQFADLLSWIFFRYLENGEKSYIDAITIENKQIT